MLVTRTLKRKYRNSSIINTDMSTALIWQNSKANIKYFPPSPEYKFVSSSRRVPEIRDPRDPITEGDKLPNIGIKTHNQISSVDVPLIRLLNERAGFIQGSSENRKLQLMIHQKSAVFDQTSKIGIAKERIRKIIHKQSPNDMNKVLGFEFVSKKQENVTNKVTSLEWEKCKGQIKEEYQSNKNATSNDLNRNSKNKRSPKLSQLPQIV